MKTTYFKTLLSIVIVVLFVLFYQRAKATATDTSLQQKSLTQTDTSRFQKPKRLKRGKKVKKDEDDNEDGVDDDIRARAHQEFLQQRDPKLNRVPLERLLTARQKRDEFLNNIKARKTNTLPQGNIVKPGGNTQAPSSLPPGAPPGASPSSISGLQWQERGPNNVGGRTRALMFDMGDAANGYKRVIAGGVGGGLWITSDITATTVQWTKVNDFFDNIAISCIAQNPNNPLEIYAGTGEGFFNEDAIQGLGVWKSSDGGATWAQLTSTTGFKFINAILVDKNGSVYIAGLSDQTVYPFGAFGVEQSTNGGNTWTNVITSTECGADLQMAANGDVYASTGIIFSNGHIYMSDYTVNGANTGNAGTWANITPSTTGVITPATTSWDRIKLATAPNAPNLVYAFFEPDYNIASNTNLTSVQLYNKTTNTWTVKTVPSEAFANGQSWYSIAAAVDPNNSSILYAGSLDAEKSTDGGSTWTRYTYWNNPTTSPYYVHADHHAYVYAPGSSSEIIMGTDGGVFYSINANGTPTFVNKNNGYDVTQFYSVALHPTNSNYGLAGAQDNGSEILTGAGIGSSTTATGGDGADVFIDQTNGNIQVTSYVYDQYYVSTNNGASFNALQQYGNGQFINPTAYDPSTKSLYAGSASGYYYRAENLLSPSYNEVQVSGFAGANVTAVSVSPLTANRVYFGLDNGNVVRVDNAQTGTSLTGVVLQPNGGVSATVSHINVDTTNEDHILVTYSNYGVAHILETKNGSAATPTWTDITGNLPDMPVRWSIFYPGDPTKAIIATELGVWTTDLLNGSSTVWDPSNTGLANVEVQMLNYRAGDKTLAAATHGRGVFTCNLKPIITVTGTLAALTTSPGTPSSSESFNISGSNLTGNITVTAPAGFDVSPDNSTWTGAAGNYTVTTTGTLASTPVYVRLDAGDAVNSYSGNVSVSGGGATTVTEAIPSSQVFPPPALSYVSPQNYSAGLAITPLTPTNTGGAVAAPGYSNSLVARGSGFNGPTGVTVDGAGNLYIADFTNKLVKEIPSGSNTPAVIGSGFTNPYSTALDAAGDVYVADYGASAVYKIPAGNGTPVTIGSGFNHPTGIAVDAAGNVYVADYDNNAVKKIPAGSNTPVAIGSGFNHPIAVALDASGDLYVADYNNNVVKEIPAGSNTPAAIGSGFSNPIGIAIDASGNIFIGDKGNNVVKEIPAGSNTPAVIASGFNAPHGVASDAAGNIYVADFKNNAVDQIKPVGGYYIGPFLPVGLTFNNTTGILSGTATGASPATNYTITAYNAVGSGTATVNISVNASPPAISYSSPQTYTVGTAITPLTPTSSNVAAPAYSITAVTVGTGFSGPTGVAADAAGDVFIADYGNKLVKKIPAGSTTATTIGSGFTNPFGVAVDAAGDVYVADYGASAVYKIPAGSNTPAAIGSGFNHPTGVAVDAAGNVYVADHANNEIKKIPVGSNTPVVIGSGFSGPIGVAVDAQGNVYIGDNGNNAVKKMPAGSNTPAAIGSGFSKPYGVAVDAEGNVFVDDYGNNAIKEIPAGSTTPVTIGSGFATPEGVAANGAGDLYVADHGNNAIKEIKPFGGYFVGPFLPAGLAFSNTTGTISGTPTIASPATNYTVTAYNFEGSGTAAVHITVNGPPVISYTSPQTYTEGTVITALSPTGSGVAAPGYNGTPTTAGTGFSGATGVATDAAGDVFIADYGNKAVKKIAAGSNTPTAIGSGFTNPFGVAVDAAGDVYVADYGASAVYKIPAGSNTPAAIGSGFNHPTGVAIDAAGNVYVADHANNEIKKIPAGSNTPAVIGSGFTGPIGVAVDAQGNVYIGDNGNNAVKKIPAGSNTPTTIGSGFSKPYGVAVDAEGNVFVDDYGNNAVKEIPAGSSTPVSLGTGFSSPEGIAADGAGNVYVADHGNNAIKRIKPVGGYYIGPFLPAGLAFNNTTGILSGTPTVASPATNYTVTAYNTYGSGAAKVNIAVLSNNASLSNLVFSSGALTPVFAAATISYTQSVANTVASVTVTPTASVNTATVKVNGTAITSGTASGSIALAVGANTITTIVTAQNGTTTKTYTVVVTRASGGNDGFDPGISVTKPTEAPTIADDGIVVHLGVSPNGDGINDFLRIDNITKYPDNKLSIMNRNGQLVYEASGYNNNSKVFDGHSNKNGQMQLPGTYFYQLAYTVKGIVKYKTGFLVLKY
jgi:gliding motility-associated-like protein